MDGHNTKCKRKERKCRNKQFTLAGIEPAACRFKIQHYRMISFDRVLKFKNLQTPNHSKQWNVLIDRYLYIFPSFVNLVDSSLNLWANEKKYILVCKGKCTSPHNNKFISILTKSSINSWFKHIVSGIMIMFKRKKRNGKHLHCVRMKKLHL